MIEKKSARDWGKGNWIGEAVKKRAKQSTAKKHLFVFQLAIDTAIL